MPGLNQLYCTNTVFLMYFLTEVNFAWGGSLNKLSLAGLAKLSWQRYSIADLLTSAGCRGLGVHDRPV